MLHKAPMLVGLTHSAERSMSPPSTLRDIPARSRCALIRRPGGSALLLGSAISVLRQALRPRLVDALAPFVPRHARLGWLHRFRHWRGDCTWLPAGGERPAGTVAYDGRARVG